jgi:hypothetical protein
MRGRVVLPVILAVAIALVAVYVTGWSPSTPATPAAPSTPSMTPAQQGAAKPATSPGAKAARKVSPPATTTPKAAPKPGGNATQSAQQPAANAAKKPQPQPSTDPVRFGPVGDAGWGSETNVSPDRRALTTTFSDLQVGLDNEDAPDPSRSMGMTIPLHDGAEGETLYIHAQGYSFASDATAQLVLRAGGRTIVQPFPAGSDDSFLTTLELPAVPGATYQLSAVLEVEQSSDAEAAAYLNILSIDAEIR